MKTYNIVLLPGDGVGPEVTAVARDVLAAIGDLHDRRFAFDIHSIGGAAIDVYPVPPGVFGPTSTSRSDARGPVASTVMTAP